MSAAALEVPMASLAGERVPNLGPISLFSSRPNHCGRLANGNWARPTVEGPKWECGRDGFGVRESYRVRSLCGWLKENRGALFMVLVVN